MGKEIDNSYLLKLTPTQFEEYLKTKFVNAEKTQSASIFAEISSERAAALEYFEETNSETGELEVNAKVDKNITAEDKASTTSFIDTLKAFFGIEGVKDKADTNNDGKVDDKEMKKFLSNIQGLDGDSSNLSMSDFEYALNTMGIDIKKLEDQKKAEEAELKQTLKEMNAEDQYENVANQPSYNRNTANQNGVGSYSGKDVSDAQALADAITPGNTIEELQSQKTTLESEIATKKEEVAQINSGESPALKSASDNVDTLKDSMDKAVKEDENLTKEQKEQHTKLMSSIQANDQAVAENTTAITTTEASISELNNSVSTLESSLSSLPQPTGKEEDKEKDASISARQSELKSQIDSKKQELDAKNTELNDLKTKKAELDKEKAELAKQKTALDAELLEKASKPTQDAIKAYNKAKEDFEALKSTELSKAQMDLDSKIKSLNEIDSKIQEKQNKKAEGLSFDFDENMTDAQKAEMQKFKDNFEKNKEKYEQVSKVTGIPAELIAALHWRESSGNFNTYMHNGDPLKDNSGNPIPTTHVPAGVLCNSWEESAIDALSGKNKQGLTSDSTDLNAYYEFAERYNGLGYRNKGVPSPYVWSGTSNYEQGKYVADGKYDPTVKDKQLGVAVMLKEIMS